MPGGSYRFVKRGIDVVVCLAFMPLVIPILLLVALAVRLDSPGPVLFVQQRTGKGGRRFPMWKFRTMVRNAEELKASFVDPVTTTLLAQNPIDQAFRDKMIEEFELIKAGF